MNLETYEKSFRKKLGAKVKELRIEKGLTQEDMEDSSNGIPYRTFVELERGNSNVTIHTLIKVALRLGVKPKDLFDF
ncbi:DNA-binding helix-turn-helix protein [Leptospira weilii str. 2006001853]|uniref:DNA-binding helix-turn-helix protein n=2 Tax=Leptospira weilii TaxID=28184 RepID=A0A828Z7E4_9LEPT|nr:helix-turn-helix transcriptional regulator [Leptospira weilii]EMM70810.1 DNA-binding helix-turn-helix protein [Leptospira weilii str. 2006001855]EKR66192.1 DNA-binding helix-turn-helix protein [Leptospira weilii str. 2006001853]MCL8268640.1 helix-turn-helix domain-containing protein [Leptospira weilii]QDK22179.1 helix-turn-helix transcriptional regulator [Leptospira weilii]QDK26124.1 helix-turn-helix transcriptional regulator [Leptospira weilii]